MDVYKSNNWQAMIAMHELPSNNPETQYDVKNYLQFMLRTQHTNGQTGRLNQSPEKGIIADASKKHQWVKNTIKFQYIKDYIGYKTTIENSDT